MEHVEGAPWRGYGNAEARVEWNGMDMDPHYGSICGFRGMDLNPDYTTYIIEFFVSQTVLIATKALSVTILEENENEKNKNYTYSLGLLLKTDPKGIIQRC
jgi:hypothetical protein